MKSLHTKHIVILSACTIVLGIFLGCPFLSQAASHDITVKNGDQLNIPLYTGDNGTITTDRTTITIPESVITPDPSTETTKPDDAASLPSQPDSSNKNPENSAPDKGNASDTSGNPPAVPDTSEKKKPYRHILIPCILYIMHPPILLSCPLTHRLINFRLSSPELPASPSRPLNRKIYGISILSSQPRSHFLSVWI